MQRAPGHGGSFDEQNVELSFRESSRITGCDPSDINRGSSFVFLKRDATEPMRRNKQKVRYIFEGEDEAADNKSEKDKNEKNDNKILVEEEKKQESNREVPQREEVPLLIGSKKSISSNSKNKNKLIDVKQEER